MLPKKKLSVIDRSLLFINICLLVTFSRLLPKFILLKNTVFYSGVCLSRILSVSILLSLSSWREWATGNAGVQK